MKSHSQRHHDKIYFIKNNIPVFGVIISSKFIKGQDVSMMSCRQKVTKLGRIGGFLSRLIEIVGLLQYLHPMINLPAQTGTSGFQLQFQQSFYTMSNKMTQRHGIDARL